MLLSKLVNRKNKGFTLVELMVVVVIIGVLVAIAIPIYNAVTERAEKGAAEANARIINGALSTWMMEDEANDVVGLADLAAVEAALTEDFMTSADWADIDNAQLSYDNTATGRWVTVDTTFWD